MNKKESRALQQSRIQLFRDAANFKKTVGVGIRETFLCASTNAARALGLYDRIGSIHPGKRADLIITDEAFTLKQVIFGGSVFPEIRN